VNVNRDISSGIGGGKNPPKHVYGNHDISRKVMISQEKSLEIYVNPAT
jgi:hypothetical protein